MPQIGSLALVIYPLSGAKGGGQQNFSPLQAILSTFCCFPEKKNPNKIDPWGAGGSPNNLFTQVLVFLWLKTPCKISKPYDNSFWEKSNPSGKERKKRR